MTGEWLGYVAATLTTLAFVPQATQAIRCHDTRSISLPMYVTFTTGVTFWLGYGLVLEAWPIIMANAVTLALAITILALKLRYG